MHFKKIFEDKKYVVASLATTIVLGLAYSFLYGLWRIPYTDIGFVRTAPVTFLDYLFVLVVSLLGGFTLQLMRSRATKTSTALGGVGSFFAAACSHCFGITFVALGATAFLPLHPLIPYLDYLKLAVLATLAFAFYKSVEATCKTRPTKHHHASASLPHLPILLLLLISISLLAYQATQLLALQSPAQPTHDAKTNELLNISSQVLPENGYTSKVKWGTVVNDMIKAKVLDPKKLEQLLLQRYGQSLKPEWKKLLAEEKSNEYIKIDNENAVFMMYLLWVFAKHNKNDILLSSPFASSFEGYDIGVGKPGYGDVLLLDMPKKQLEIARFVAENSYRPCCGQSAARPDCSHGFSLLGLLEIGAAQGLSKEQLFEDARGFNAFWYPSHYIQVAAYFKLKEGKDWEGVSAEKVMSYDYSSIAAARRIQQELAVS